MLIFVCANVCVVDVLIIVHPSIQPITVITYLLLSFFIVIVVVVIVISTRSYRLFDYCRIKLFSIFTGAHLPLPFFVARGYFHYYLYLLVIKKLL